jgi:hypothetical protein
VVPSHVVANEGGEGPRSSLISARLRCGRSLRDDREERNKRGRRYCSKRGHHAEALWDGGCSTQPVYQREDGVGYDQQFDPLGGGD